MEQVNEQKIVSDYVKCNDCGQVKIRIENGYFDKKNKRYVDAKNDLWCGRKCPECTRNAKRASMARLKAKRNAEGKSNET